MMNHEKSPSYNLYRDKNVIACLFPSVRREGLGLKGLLFFGQTTRFLGMARLVCTKIPYEQTKKNFLHIFSDAEIPIKLRIYDEIN